MSAPAVDKASSWWPEVVKGSVDSPAGGDSACWAHLMCDVCGVPLESGPHAHEDELD